MEMQRKGRSKAKESEQESWQGIASEGRTEVSGMGFKSFTTGKMLIVSLINSKVRVRLIWGLGGCN